VYHPKLPRAINRQHRIIFTNSSNQAITMTLTPSNPYGSMEARSSANTKSTNYYDILNHDATPYDPNQHYHAYRSAFNFSRRRERDHSHENRNERRKRRRQKRNERRSGRRVRRQRRAQSLRDKKAARSFDDQFRQFDRGSKKYRKKFRPSFENLVQHVNREHRKARAKQKRPDLRVNALELAQVEREASSAIRREVEELEKSGKYGHVAKRKPDNTIRIFFENFNSLGVWATGKARRKKIRCWKRLLKEYDVDLFAGCETQTDWRFAKDHEKFENLFGQGQERKSVVGFNTSEQKITRRQHGGTAMMALGRLSSQVNEAGADESKLGRWCWMKVGGGGKTTAVCMAYQPCAPGDDTAGQTSWDQQARHFEARGDGRSPRDIFFEQLVEQLLQWKEEGLEIILMGDFNEDVYKDRLAK